MTHSTFVAILAAFAAMAAVPAAAQQAERGGEVTRSQAEDRAGRMFDRMDANRDGRLDAADRQERQRARFARLDANGDGAISFEEFTATRERAGGRRGEPRAEARQPRPGNAAERAITREEFTARAGARFDSADVDGDGVLSAEERRGARGMMRGMRQGRTESR